MNYDDLKKMSRMELIELMIDQSREIDRLREQLQAAREKLNDRNQKVSKAGNLADASVEIYQLVDNAKKAAKLYLENVKNNADSLR